MKLGKRAMLRPSSVLIPEGPKSGVVVRPRGLMYDDREDRTKGRRFLERRRHDCAHLRACEWGWIDNQIAEGKAIGVQAKCPENCSYYEQKDFREPTKIDKSLVRIRRSA